MAKSAKGFIVILPQTIIEIPQDSYLSWLTLFYALPKELVEKRNEYLYLPRNITQLLNEEDSIMSASAVRTARARASAQSLQKTVHSKFPRNMLSNARRPWNE